MSRFGYKCLQVQGTALLSSDMECADKAVEPKRFIGSQGSAQIDVAKTLAATPRNAAAPSRTGARKFIRQQVCLLCNLELLLEADRKHRCRAAGARQRAA